LDDLNCDGLSATDRLALTKNAAAIAKKLDHQTTEKKITYLKDFIHKITVSQHQVVINLRGEEVLNHCLKKNLLDQNKSDASNPIKLTVLVHLKRCGIETKLIMVNGPTPEAHPSSVKILQTALLKALTWNQELITGKVLSASEIARREKVTSRYVTHILKLAFLAPEIIKLIAAGKVPNGVNLEIFKTVNLGLCWKNQVMEILNK